ncbi:MAG: hypothetical protein GY749_00505 [Desulfobacteraceae bacterium]|nr:hypothetical protein [Desulfobacteraceae bacterium]
MEDIKPFTYEDIIQEKDGFPSRGIYCPKCKVNIPVFAELSKEDEAEIRKNGKGNVIETIRLIREKTGCGLRWAKIWAIHPDGPQEIGFQGNGKCPYCGGRLRTEKAKQCPHCLISWHDPNNIKKLGT